MLFTTTIFLIASVLALAATGRPIGHVLHPSGVSALSSEQPPDELETRSIGDLNVAEPVAHRLQARGNGFSFGRIKAAMDRTRGRYEGREYTGGPIPPGYMIMMMDDPFGPPGPPKDYDRIIRAEHQHERLGKLAKVHQETIAHRHAFQPAAYGGPMMMGQPGPSAPYMGSQGHAYYGPPVRHRSRSGHSGRRRNRDSRRY